jgi:hypothetical protein
MIEKSPLDPATIKSWMHNAGVDHYLCGQCHGLHLSELQGLEGVVESRLLVEEWGLLISTEYLIRPTALLPIAADLGHLNANYPILKLFPDVVDDAMPQLIAGATFLTGAGMTEAQFALFTATAQEAMTQLAGELKQLDFLLPDEEGEKAPAGHRYH